MCFLKQTNERLPIYWKVLERGSKPNFGVPTQALMKWAGIRFGNPAIGWIVAKKIRRYGVSPNPILQTIFVLDSDFKAIGLTDRGTSIIRTAASEFKEGLEQFWNGQIRRRSPITGRFLPV